MIIGVPRELKESEGRVALTPAGAKDLIEAGHKVFVEQYAGARSGHFDDAYRESGAKVIRQASFVWEYSDLIVKVKEPIHREYKYFRDGPAIFTYLHLASNARLLSSLVKHKVTAYGYETVVTPDGTLPLLSPMSRIAGKLAGQVGARLLESPEGGKGILVGGIALVPRAKVTVLGGGNVGLAATEYLAYLGADVTVLDKNEERLKIFREHPVLGILVKTRVLTAEAVDELVPHSDIVIGAVYNVGAKTPHFVSEKQAMKMEKGSVLIDVAIDQGGCFETSRPRTLTKPTFKKHGVIHYCVTNMPGAVPRTSTAALTKSTLPYVVALAALGDLSSIPIDPVLRSGLQVFQGTIVHPALLR